MPEISRNPLSCHRCKGKKIKCGREEPKCDKCTGLSLECGYPVRRKRKHSNKKRADILSQILQRLETLEKRAGLSPQKIKIDLHSKSDHKRDSESSSDDEGSTDSEEGERRSTTRAESETPFKTLYQLMDEAASKTKNVLRTEPEDPTPYEEPDAIFSKALTSIRNFRWKDDKTSDTDTKLKIPSQMALRWVELCFDIRFFAELIGLENRNLMMAMPGMMDLPVVQVHDSVLVVYYSVLFCGWRSDEKSSLPGWNDYGRRLYRECLKILPGWKNDGLPVTPMDFTGTGMMSILAVENFDYHLGWDLHFDCCTLARDLNLHNLDAADPNDRPGGYEDEGKKNALRKKMWQLIHTEYFFRLYYDKPPTMTGSDFSVNFPSIVAAPESANRSDTVYFLVSSRNVFITKEFFDVLQDPGEDLKHQVDSLAAQIENVMIEWNLEELLANSSSDRANAWVYADLLISGYITIILMDRKASGTRTKNEQPSTRSVHAARKTLETIINCSAMFSRQSPNIMGFISFYPFVAFFTLYHQLLSVLQQGQKAGKSALEEIEKDIGLMEKLGTILGSLATFQDEFRLIAKAVTALTKSSRYAVSASLPNTPISTSQSPPESRTLRGYHNKHLETVSTDSPEASIDSDTRYSDRVDPSWPLLEAGLRRNDLQTPWMYVESMESDLFGRNWHQAWWDQ